jgi:hypothetical protein
METKPRFTAITDPGELAVLTVKRGDLECPWLWTDGTGHWFGDTDQLRAWRKLRESQNQSTGEHNEG